MPNYDDYQVVSKLLGQAQDADKDMRDLVREQRHFLHVKDGQWEPDVWSRMRDHPRYTIDKTTPLIEETTGRIKKSDFGIKVQPVDNAATEDGADIIAGLIRNISNLSGADHIYNQAVTSVVESGLDGWEVVQEYADQGAFHQDILIKPVNNYVDRVWFDHASMTRTPETARHAFKLTSFALDEYKEKWPKGSAQSVSEDKTFSALKTNTDNVIVGQVYYLKETNIELVLMSDGKVYADNDKFKSLVDELAMEGITEEKRRSSKRKTQWIRQFDGGGWLKEAEETAFDYISLVPEYGKFSVIDNVITYRGMTLKLMDPQRIYNYARSRQIEEGALAPRDKMMATLEQIGPHTTEWETMNTNADAVLPYVHQANQPPPYKIGGSQVNVGLETTALSMTDDMRQVANKFAASMGDGINARSGVIVDELKESSMTGDIDWTEGHEIALCYTYKVILSGIRKVYDGTRMARILNEDGTHSMEELNTTRLDRQTGEIITINDLSGGLYDVVCSAGKSYKSRKGETINGILEIGAIDPSVIMEGQDILVAASDGPGMADIAERIRARKFKNGEIPPSQWTEEEQIQAEQEAAQAQNQPPPPDPMMLAAQAEMAKAQNEAQQNQDDMQYKMAELQLKNRELDLKEMQLHQKGQEIAFNAQNKQQASEYANAKTVSDIQNKNADTAVKMSTAALNAQELEDQQIAQMIENMPTEQLVRMLS